MNRLIVTHVDAVKSAFRYFFKQAITSLLILLMLGIALALPLSLYLVVESSKSVLGELTASPQITLYMDMMADAQDIEETKRKLDNNPQIKDIKFIDKATALETMQNSLEQGDLLSILDENPLPDLFVLTPQSSIPQDVESLQQQLNAIAMVENAEVDTKWMNTLFKVEQFLKQVLWFLAITLCLAFVLISHNTIRLQILACKDEIEITKLLGASSSFIRLPFLYLAILQGLLSLLISLGLSFWLMKKALPSFNQIIEPYGINMTWYYFSPLELLSVVLIIVFLAIFGAAWATWQHLQHFKSQS